MPRFSNKTLLKSTTTAGTDIRLIREKYKIQHVCIYVQKTRQRDHSEQERENGLCKSRTLDGLCSDAWRRLGWNVEIPMEDARERMHV